jgi:hypothetical protein
MTAIAIRTQLEELLDLLGRERECAVAIDMVGLQQLVEQKATLIAEIDLRRDDSVECRDLLLQIDHENRRNAFLHRSGLNWFRGMLDAFAKATTSQVYTRGGASQQRGQGGCLLSGKI